MKKGMARSAKLSKAVAMRCARVVNEGIVDILTNIVNSDDIPMLYAMGTPTASRKRNENTNMPTSMNSILFQFG